MRQSHGSIEEANRKYPIDICIMINKIGETTPIKIRFEDEHGDTIRLHVQLIGKPYPAASRKLGGVGICYNVVARPVDDSGNIAREVYSWLLEDAGQWSWHTP